MAGLPLAGIHRKKMNTEELLYNDKLAISSVSSFKLALVALLSAHLLKHHVSRCYGCWSLAWDSLKNQIHQQDHTGEPVKPNQRPDCNNMDIHAGLKKIPGCIQGSILFFCFF